MGAEEAPAIFAETDLYKAMQSSREHLETKGVQLLLRARVLMLCFPVCPGTWAVVERPISYRSESRLRNRLISSPMPNLQ
jgi:hypothetical protein